MRIAVIGSGIAGMASAWLLSRQHEVTLYEANAYIGGHTHTHDVALGGRRYAVDTGFIVFNRQHYPLLGRLLEELDVLSQPTTMSFAVRNERSGLEYGAASLRSLFCQRRNLVSPRFLAMVRDIYRFYREAPALLDQAGEGPTLGDYLAGQGYGAAFRDDHLVPMASALWSSPSRQILAFPAKYLVAFMANHHMLQVEGRPQWRVVSGGSRRYVDALRMRWRVRERIACPVLAVHRPAVGGVEVQSLAGSERFDQAVLACHSDQALALLAQPSAAEREVLGAITYQSNDKVLHTDTRLLPRRRSAWSAWNALVPGDRDDACTVTYCMNLLQSIQAPETFCVSLNCTDRIDPAKILRRLTYAHPEYTHAAVAAQRRKADIQGVDRLWYAGAYWGWGFHEDGMRSAVAVAEALGVRW
jgi:uncharacterized protein